MVESSRARACEGQGASEGRASAIYDQIARAVKVEARRVPDRPLAPSGLPGSTAEWYQASETLDQQQGGGGVRRNRRPGRDPAGANDSYGKQEAPQEYARGQT